MDTIIPICPGCHKVSSLGAYEKGMLAAGVLAAIGASLRCVAPLVLLVLGVSGAWIASLVATEPYRPALVAVALLFFAAVALLFFALACRRLYLAPSACTPGQACMDSSVLRRQRILASASYSGSPSWQRLHGSADCDLISLMKEKPMSWIIKMMAVGLLATSTTFAAEPQTAILDVKNMQCQMCSITVRKALQKVPGVEDAKVDFDRKNATVKFDPVKTSPDALAAATTKAGFPSTVHKE